MSAGVNEAVDYVRKHPGCSLEFAGFMSGEPGMVEAIGQAVRAGLIEQRFFYPRGRRVRYYVVDKKK